MGHTRKTDSSGPGRMIWFFFIFFFLITPVIGLEGNLYNSNHQQVLEVDLRPEFGVVAQLQIDQITNWPIGIMTALLILGMILAMGGYLWKQHRRVQKEREILEVTLRNIGDGVITTDVRGNVVLVNSVAETLTGWSQAQAAGRPLGEIFQIINEQTEQPCENPVAKVLETGQVVNLSHCSALIARNGTRRIIADSASPIRDAHGNILGAVLVFRDETEFRRTEEILRDQQRIIKQILEDTLAGYWDWDIPAGREYLSPTFKKMFGYEEDELPNVPDSWQWLIFPEDLERVTEIFNQHVKSRGAIPYYAEVRYRHKDGSTVWVICTGKVISWDAEGKPIRMVGCHINITERKRTEEALRSSEEKFRNLIESSSDWIWEVNAEGVYTYVSPQVEAILGYKPQDVVGKTPFDLMPPEEATQIEGIFKDLVVKGQSIVALENINLHKDGRRIVLETSGVPFFDNTGKIIGWRGVDRDITERKQVEARLREWQDLMQYIIRYDPNAIAVLDKDMRYIFVSERFLNDYRVKEQDVIGKNHYDVFPEMPERWKQIHQRVLAGAIERSEEDSFVRLDGSVDYNRWECRPWYKSDGTIGGMIMYTEVITERKRAEQALRTSENLLASIFLAAPTGIGVVSNRVLLMVNDRLCEMCGYSREELVGNSSRILYANDAEFEYVGEEKYRQIREHGTGTVETRWKCKAGQIIDVLLSSTPLNPQDLTAGVTFTALDITDRKRAEEALRASEEKFRVISQLSPTGIYLTDVQGECVYVNTCWCKMAGLTLEEALGMGWINGVHPEDRQQILDEWLKIIASKGHWDREYRFQNKEGKTTLVYGLATPLTDANGTMIGYVGVNVDITERKRAEQALRESENLLASVFRVAPIGVGVVRNRVLQFVNNYMCQVSGYTREELIGKTTRIAYLSDADFEYVGVESLRQIRERGTATVETRWRSKEGRIFDVILNAAPINPQDSSAGITFIALDISDLKRYQDSLVRRNRELQILSRFAQIVNTVLETPVILRQLVASAIELTGAESGAAGLMVDGELVLNEYNRRGQIIPIDHHFPEGYGVPGLVIKTKAPYFSNDAVHDPHVIPEIQQALGFKNLIDVPILSRDGRMLGCFEIHNKIEGVFEQSDIDMLSGLAASAAIALENTQLLLERKRAEEEIRNFNAELEQRVIERTAELLTANQELEAFSYSVSHDLRAPLRGIDGFSQILLEQYAGKIDAEGQDYLRRVVAASRYMGGLIDDLLRLARITRSEIHRSQMNLSGMVEEIAEELRETQPDRVVEFVIEPELIVNADENLIRIALQNLLSNAWKFTARVPQARIEFGTIQIEGERTFYIRDNGAGFNMAYVEKLFGVFQRLHAANEFEGTGIGLAIVQRIIRRHGGRIWAQGEVDKGSTFYFTLPG